MYSNVPYLSKRARKRSFRASHWIVFIQTSEETKFSSIPLDRIYPNERGNEVFEHPHWIVICQTGKLENFVSSLVWIDM